MAILELNILVEDGRRQDWFHLAANEVKMVVEDNNGTDPLWLSLYRVRNAFSHKNKIRRQIVAFPQEDEAATIQLRIARKKVKEILGDWEQVINHAK